MSDAYLVHHGIPGQKWGKRNGPPYPLNESDKSSAEKKEEHSRKGLSNGAKTAIKIGAVAAGVAIAGVGAYKLVDSGVLDNLVKIGKNGVKETLVGADNIVSISSKHMSTTDVFENANHLEGNERTNSCFQTALSAICSKITGKPMTAVADLDENGIGKAHMVAAELDNVFNGQLTNQYGDYKTSQVRIMSDAPYAKSSTAAKEALVKWFGNDASGIISTDVLTPNNQFNGHAFNFEIKSGKVEFYDALAKVEDSLAKKYFDIGRGNFPNKKYPLTAVRLDNLDFNNIDKDALSRFSREL